MNEIILHYKLQFLDHPWAILAIFLLMFFYIDLFSGNLLTGLLSGSTLVLAIEFLGYLSGVSLLALLQDTFIKALTTSPRIVISVCFFIAVLLGSYVIKKFMEAKREHRRFKKGDVSKVYAGISYLFFIASFFAVSILAYDNFKDYLL